MHKLQNSRLLWLGITIAVTLLWIDPTGLGHMPVGGDATRFGLGLMSEMTRAAGDARAPLWNSLWGYGFPALAESQLGVFYPPHVVLFGCLPLEWAYAADRALHAVWAACGCWALCRILGRSAAASFLAAAAFVTSGFFLVHDTHHWAWPTTSWMPWIWWAMMRVVRSDPVHRFERASLAVELSFCAAMPVLTGHFQMGFVAILTGFVLVAALSMFEARTESVGVSRSLRIRALVLISLAVAFAAMFAAVQILPTAELARLADNQRDWEYLSGFAAPPLHWLGLLLPGLGRCFPFWRPLLWDQFHTSPEELFFYVGLVPLWLAVFGAIRTWRLEPGTRALVATLAVTLIFAAGPYGPGFSQAIRLPGFSFFRAPARWTAASTLVIALLAARGLDALISSSLPPVKSFRRFFVGAIVVSGLSILGIEGLIRLSEGPGRDDGAILKSLDLVRSLAMPPWQDVATWKDWVRRGMAVAPAPIPAYVKPYTELDRQRFSTDRPFAWLTETGPHLGLMAAAAVLSFAVRGSKRRMLALIFLIMVVDAAIARRYRSAELAPVAHVRSRSPVLARLGQVSKDSDWPLAIAGDLGNLPMAVGSSPIRAYRTLDVPVMPELDAVFLNPVETTQQSALRLTGVGFVLIDPPTWRVLKNSWRPNAEIEEIDDPALWSWLTTSHVAARGPSTFALVKLPGPRGRAWRVDEASLAAKGITQVQEATRPDRLEAIGAAASPLDVKRPVPERMSLEARTNGPELWIVSQWADPNWRATLADGSGAESDVEIVAMAGGWQGVRIPRAGGWKLTLSYDPASYRTGAAISAVALGFALTILFVRSWKSLKEPILPPPTGERSPPVPPEA